MAKAMSYRSMGNSGLKLSAFGLGGWTTYGGSVTDEALVAAIIKRAYDAGINFYDIADIYAKGESEKAMGKVLRQFPRHTLVISTKVFWPMSEDVNDKGLSRKHIMESIDKSLQRIGTDYVDLYFCHRPDPETPIAETVRAMDDLVRRGKVLYWGTSEWSGAQIREASAIANRLGLYAPQVEQPQLSLLEHRIFESDTQPAAEAHGMGLVTWSPLASGLLSGKYDEGLPEGARLSRVDWLRDKLLTDENRERVKQLKDAIQGLGCSRAQLALAWVASRRGVSSVITGATSVAQLEENLGALEIEITPAIAARLDALFPAA